MNIGERIKLLRKQNNINQEALATVLRESYGMKTDRAAVSKWETGFQLPGIQALMAIADYFGVSMDFFVNYQNEQNRGKLVPFYPQYPDTKNVSFVVCDTDADMCISAGAECVLCDGIGYDARIFVSTNAKVRQGDIAVAMHSNKLITGKYYKNGSNVVLVAGINAAPVMCPEHNIKIVGKVKRVCYDFD